MSQHASQGAELHPHVLPLKVYFGVWGALTVLTVITVAASYVDIGSPGNILLAMLIASIKGSLVCLYFMHLKYDDRFNSVLVMAAFGFLALLFVFTFADFDMRGQVDPLEEGTIEVLPKESIYDPSHGADHDAEGHEAAPADGDSDEGH